ncbi:hypothetical protein EZ456_04120 [Pedobacter psychrodurus]|uniref:Uncharacterized protein n=1 Tax=Pedobacter psychrodurus TaxID=2530456 RepID=A0A4R0Q9L2_9SPHI|nr:hypothetical protein [Pedobacter psychrodurus]TCD28584.1 hypothetical protein EZ456_04120 [Pedobacter psychrodurus]
MSNTINYSSEMMTNYLQASIMSPDATFEVLQNSLGNALLFSIGTDGVFYVTYESPADSSAPTGWTRLDLSTPALTGQFSGGICTKISVAQNQQVGTTDYSTIGLAMVVTVNGEDNLFLCTGNSDSDMSWLSAPVWVYAAYDSQSTPPSPFVIANVFISETDQGQFIIADLDNQGIVDRFYIAQNSRTQWWNNNSLPIDLNTNDYMGCIGRASVGGAVDGMYTGGSIDGTPQLIYCPVYNAFGAAPPSPSTLFLPGNLVPQAMAAFRNGSSNCTSDLLVTSVADGEGSLYYFAYDNQSSNATGELLLQNSLLINVSYLQAAMTDNILTVWGLNGADELFYLTCPYTLGQPGTWSEQTPLPIATKVNLVSPYVNLSNDANTIFAVAVNTLFILTRSIETSLWTTTQVILPPPLTTSPALSYNSYTTTIQLLNQYNQPMAGSPLMLSSDTRATFYINNLYYVLDTTPVPVNTDGSGNVTIIESTTDLTGTLLYVSEDASAAVSINPMDTVFNSVAQLNTVTSLQNAVVTDQYGNTTPLVPAGTSTENLQTVASSNQSLATAYNSFSSPEYTLAVSRFNRFNAPVLVGFESAIMVDAGDLFRMLDSAVDYVVHVVQDAASGVWNFIAEIAGDIYQAMLTTIYAVAGAVEWVFKQIEVAIEDLIAFLSFLFSWEDIVTTHKVMKNIFIQSTQQAIDSLEGFGTAVPVIFTELINMINGWADIPTLNQTADSTTAGNAPPTAQNSSPSTFISYHFQGNVSSASTSYSAPSYGQEIFQDLLTLLKSEEGTLQDGFEAIYTQIIEPFTTLTATEIIQRFIAIVTDTLLEATEAIIIAIIQVLVQITSGIIELMTAPINFPVISDIYKWLTGDQLSFLDAVCLVAAVPTTLCYKISNDAATGSKAAPFPNGAALTNALLNANSFAEVQNAFYSTAPSSSQIGTEILAADASPVLNESAMKVFGFVTDFFALGGCIVCGITSSLLKGLSAIKLPQPKFLLTINAIGNVAYVSPNLPAWINIKTDDASTDLNNGLTAISIIKGFSNIFFSSYETYSKLSSAMETIINFVWNEPVIATIIENADNVDTTYKSLIPASMGNFAFNFGGMLELPIAFAESKPIAWGVLVTAQDGLMLTYGLCMPIAGGIYAFKPGQTVN